MSEENAENRKAAKQAAVRAEIKSTALTLLKEGGFESLSMHKIAKQMKTTTPALYYYYKNRNDLLADLSTDALTNLENFLRQTHIAHQHEAYIRQAFMILSSYYNWARENPSQYQLLFGSPIPEYEPSDEVFHQSLRVMSVFIEVCDKAAWMGLLARPTMALTPTMRQELEQFSVRMGVKDLTPETLFQIIAGWARLHGLISLELNGYLPRLLSNLDRTYFLEARKLLEELGFNYQTAGSPR